MPTATLEAGSAGAGNHLPPLTDQRTPDESGDKSDWNRWEGQFSSQQTLERLLGIGVEKVRNVGSGVVGILQPRLPVDIEPIVTSTPFIALQRGHPKESYPGSGVYFF